MADMFWTPSYRRDSDQHWAALLQTLFVILEPDVPTNLRGVLDGMKGVADAEGIPSHSIDALVHDCEQWSIDGVADREGVSRVDGVNRVDAQFLRAYTAEMPAIYKLCSKHFNAVTHRLLDSSVSPGQITRATIPLFFSQELVACAGFYIRVRQALHRLPSHFRKQGDSFRGVRHRYGVDLTLFEERLVSTFTLKSTSTDREVAQNFVKGSGTLFRFKNTIGWDISKFSLFDEKETVIDMFNEFTAEVNPDDNIDEIALEPQQPWTICSLGMMGDGKSSTLRTLSRTSFFDNERKELQLGCCTQEVHDKVLPWLGCGAAVKFVDTPGYEGSGKDVQNLHGIQRNIAEKIRFIDAFILVIKYAPVFPSHWTDMLRSYQMKFGNDFSNRLIIVVTHWDYNERFAKRSRHCHLNKEDIERYEHDMNVKLKEALNVAINFEFVFMDNECSPEGDEEDGKELRLQSSKLWRFMTDTSKKRFDGHDLTWIYSVDTAGYRCSCLGCDDPTAVGAAFWQQCTEPTCEHFRKVYHYSCWRRVHAEKQCGGKVHCERSFFEKHADQMDSIAHMIKRPEVVAVAGMAGADALGELAANYDAVTHLGDIVQYEASEIVSHVAGEGVHMGLEEWANELARWSSDTLSHCDIHFVGPLVGCLLAFAAFSRKRRANCDLLAKNYREPGSGLSPEDFAIQTAGDYKAFEARLVSGGCFAAAGAVLGFAGVVTGPLATPFWICLALVAAVVHFKARDRGRQQGKRQAEEAFKRSHWHIVAQCLHTLELASFINKKLQDDVKKLQFSKITSFYRQLAVKEHPDKVRRFDCDDAEMLQQRIQDATSKFCQIADAYQILEAYQKTFKEDEWTELLEGAYSLMQEAKKADVEGRTPIWKAARTEDVNFRELVKNQKQGVFEGLPGGLRTSIADHIASTKAQMGLEDKKGG